MTLVHHKQQQFIPSEGQTAVTKLLCISQLLFIACTTTIIIMHYNDYLVKKYSNCIFLMPFVELEGADGKRNYCIWKCV